MVLDPRGALPMTELGSAELEMNSSPVNLAVPEQSQDQVMHEPRRTMANLALTQGWSFAGVAADTRSPESASPGIVSANSQEPVQGVSVSDGIERGVSEAEAAAQDSTPTETAAESFSSKDTQVETPSFKDTQTSVSSAIESSDGEDDIVAVIRRCNNRSVKQQQTPAIQTQSFQTRALATPDQLAGIKPQDLSRVPQNHFLAKYDYAGHKRQDPTATKEADITLKHTRKRPPPEVIDLTETLDNLDNPVVSSRAKGKRRKLEEHGREKRQSSERAESQAYDDARKERKHRSSRRLAGSGDLRGARSSTSRKSKASSRHQNRHESFKIRGRDRGQDRQQPREQSTQQPRQENHSGSRQESCRRSNDEEIPRTNDKQVQQEFGSETHQDTRQAPVQAQHQELDQNPRPDTRLKPRSGQQTSPHRQPGHREEVNGRTFNNATITDKEIINGIKHRPITAGDKARSRVEEIKAKHTAANKPATDNPSTANGHLSVSGLENDAGLFEMFSSRVPEKRSAQLVSSMPGHHGQLEPNSYRRASQRAEALLPVEPVEWVHLPSIPAANRPVSQVPRLPPTPAVQGGNRQTSHLPQSRNIFHPKPSQSRSNPQPRTDIPLSQSVLAPPPTYPRPSLNQLPPSHIPFPLRRTQRPHHQQQRQQQQQQQQQQQHLELIEPHPSAQLTPRETTTALEALGKDRVIIQYVVYRTPRFQPPTPTQDTTNDPTATLLDRTKRAKTQRCTEHLSLHQANLEAASLIERVKKGVAGKGWSMQPSVLSSSYDCATTAAGVLYEGNITFDNGDVQFAWVAEEERYLGDGGGAGGGKGPSEVVKTGGYVRVDKVGAGVYRRKRFDVWSRVFVGREVRRGKGGGGQRVVFECGGDGGGDGEGEHGDERNESEVVEGAVAEELRGGGGEIGEDDGVDGIGTNGGDAGEKADENSAPDEANHANDTGTQTSSLYPAQQTMEGSGPDVQEEEVEEEKEEAESGRLGPEAEPEAETTDGDETGDETDDDNSNDKNTRTHRAASVSSTATITFPPFTSPLDVVGIELKLHGTYTTLYHANRAALATFLELAKPKNSSINDNHHYKYDLKPGITESFEENGMGERNCTTRAEIPWDPPTGKQYRWDFLRLEVEVIESELKGPVDIGDMVVEGGGDDGQEERASDEAIIVTQQNNASEEAASKEKVNVRRPVGALPSPVEESEGEISEEE